MTQATLSNFIGANTSVSLSMLIQDTGLLVGSEKERCEVKVALSNSFGFGGHNSSILFVPYK
jgi:3-oxoacyl-[acyl-carrier-protein] synthase II